MGTVNLNNLVGLRLEDEIVCIKCITNEEHKTFTEDEAITDEQTQGDDIYFCDRCNERLS